MTGVRKHDLHLRGRLARPSPAIAPRLPAPNPFHTSAAIPFTMTGPTDVRLSVYDTLGREVAVLADGRFAAGAHTASFSADWLASGLYLLRLHAGNQIRTRSVTLLR